MNLIERRRQMMMMSKSLPYDAEIEYLESDGGQYIDTLFNPGNNDNLDMTIQNFGVKQTTGNFFAGTGNGSWSVGIGFICGIAGSSGKITWNNKRSDNNITYNLLGLTTTSPLVTLQINSSGIFVNGVYKAGFNSTAQTATLGSFFLFKLKGISLNDNYNIGGWKLGRTTIYRNGTKAFDFIPVRVGQVGYMYDRVSGQLFGNQGTGNFILGADKN